MMIWGIIFLYTGFSNLIISIRTMNLAKKIKAKQFKEILFDAEKDNANKRKLAKMDGTPYDTVNEELSKKFWWGYLAVAILGAFVAVLIAFVLTDLITAQYPIADESRLFAVYIALSVIVWVIGDYFLFTRLGDSAYFARVEYGAIKTFLGDTDEDLSEPEPEPEPEPEDLVAKMTTEQKLAIIESLFQRK